MTNKSILHYKILEKLGEGGMGVVYKAEDTKLGRTVALKMLPPHLLTSEDDKARFQREAKAAAALNHSNIATVYEINEHEGTPFIAMEYIEGQTLNHHIDKGPFNLQEAIDIAIQVAEGLKAAHTKDIVHRDIKSSNIILDSEKKAKILDFGLAKTSMSTKLTQMGSTIGTVAYMSPEQVKGQEVDHRTDLWSLGVVLYEMISGRLPFSADYDQAIFYAIQNEEPEPLTEIRTNVPMSLEWIVTKLLSKNPAERYQNSQDLIIDLKAADLNTTGMSRATKISQQKTAVVTPGKSKTNYLSWSIAAIASFLVIILAFLLFTKDNAQEQLNFHTNILAIESETQKFIRTDMSVVDISPDGSKIVYCLNDKGVTRLFLRSLDKFEIIPLEGTENASSPFFSPDGQWIGFNADGKLKKVTTFGKAVDIIHTEAAFRGASWGPNDNIIFSPNYGSGLYSIPATGGEVKVISHLDSARNERTHRWPQITPDGKNVIYTIGDTDSPNSYENAKIAIQSLETDEKHILNVRGEMARYIEPGYLIIAKNGVLLAAPFDLDSYSFVNQPIPVLSEVDGDNGSGISYFAVSSTGSIIYVQGNREQELELVLVDLDGNVQPTSLNQKAFQFPRISPDGNKVLLNLGIGSANNEDIWIYDMTNSVFSRLTYGNSTSNAIWKRDGKGFYYLSLSSKTAGIKYKDLSGQNEGIVYSFENNLVLFPISLSPDNRYLILNIMGGLNEGSIIIYDLENKIEVFNSNQSSFYEYGGDISPGGNLISYGSNETGRLEIYIKSFPDMKLKRQVSTDGGFSPKWGPDESKLYFINNYGKLMSVSVNQKPDLSIGKPEIVFDVSQMYFPNNPVANYDISQDGKHFIMVRNRSFTGNITNFNFITNWHNELEKKLSRSD